MAVGLAFAPSGVTVGEAPPPPFSPADITGLVLWLDADAITGKVDNDAISQWDDSSGSSNHVTQATGANQPLYKTGILNGLPVVRFDGTNDALIKNGVDWGATRTWIVVAKKRSAPSGFFDGIGGIATSAVGASIASLDSDHAVNWVWDKNQAGARVNMGITSTDWHIITVKVVSTSSLLVRGDGTQTASFDPDDTASVGTGIDLGQAVGLGDGDVDIAQCLIYNSALSDDDCHDVEDYFGTKYGITVA